MTNFAISLCRTWFFNFVLSITFPCVLTLQQQSPVALGAVADVSHVVQAPSGRFQAAGCLRLGTSSPKWLLRLLRHLADLLEAVLVCGMEHSEPQSSSLSATATNSSFRQQIGWVAVFFLLRETKALTLEGKSTSTLHRCQRR